jgi:hypothetical protein
LSFLLHLASNKWASLPQGKLHQSENHSREICIQQQHMHVQRDEMIIKVAGSHALHILQRFFSQGKK